MTEYAKEFELADLDKMDAEDIDRFGHQSNFPFLTFFFTKTDKVSGQCPGKSLVCCSKYKARLEKILQRKAFELSQFSVFTADGPSYYYAIRIILRPHYCCYNTIVYTDCV